MKNERDPGGGYFLAIILSAAVFVSMILIYITGTWDIIASLFRELINLSSM